MAPATPAPTKVPLVQSGPLSEFGAFEPDEAYYSASGQDRDGTYVPGFSDMRKAYDIAAARFARGEISRDAVPVLPVNVRWARNQNKAGQSDNAKQFSHGRKGYRLVTKDDLKSDWLREMPGGTSWDAAGNLRNGDTVLMIATSKDAARNKAIRERETAERLTGVTSAVASENIREAPKGADPYVQRAAAAK